MSESVFNEALQNMTYEVASAGAIRHMADLGYSVRRIKENLDFPTSEERIRATIWKYYVDSGKILLEEPSPGGSRVLKRYVKETDSFGRTTFRMVKENAGEGENTEATYFACDFGIKLARDENAFLSTLDVLSEEDRTYITDIPWPRQIVWHIEDERMKRIRSTLNP